MTVKKIPYGKTKSYKEIAELVGTSPRVVGNACKKNPLLLVIPCHRIIGHDGSLGGFSAPGGVKTKLKLEGMASGDSLEVLLDQGEPEKNVPRSIQNDGHKVLSMEKTSGHFKMVIKKF